MGSTSRTAFDGHPRLTMNLGLRWDYFGVVGEKDGLLSNITSVGPRRAKQVPRRRWASLYDKLYNPDTTILPRESRLLTT